MMDTDRHKALKFEGHENITTYYTDIVLPLFCDANTTEVSFTSVSEETRIIVSVVSAPDCGANTLADTYVLDEDCKIQTHTAIQAMLSNKSSATRYGSIL